MGSVDWPTHRQVGAMRERSSNPESPRVLWRLSCALGLARSACLIAGGWVGVTELVLDGAEHPER